MSFSYGYRGGGRSFAYGGAQPSGASAQVLAPLGAGGSWALSFHDEFSVAGAPDLNIWTYWLQDQTRRDAINRAENTFVDTSQGGLVIRTTSANIGHGSETSSGGLVAKRLFGTEFFFEARLKVANGAWLGFWTNTQNGMNGLNTPPDPSDGAEYDFVETYHGGAAQSHIHYGGYGANHHVIDHDMPSPGTFDKTIFHTYGFWLSVSSNFVRFYVDGSLNWQDSTIVSTTTDMEFLLTQEYEVAMGAAPGDNSWITIVDYARAWVPG